MPRGKRLPHGMRKICSDLDATNECCSSLWRCAGCMSSNRFEFWQGVANHWGSRITAVAVSPITYLTPRTQERLCLSQREEQLLYWDTIRAPPRLQRIEHNRRCWTWSAGMRVETCYRPRRKGGPGRNGRSYFLQSFFAIRRLCKGGKHDEIAGSSHERVASDKCRRRGYLADKKFPSLALNIAPYTPCFRPRTVEVHT